MSTTAVKQATEVMAAQTFTVTEVRDGKRTVREAEATEEVMVLIKRSASLADRIKELDAERKALNAQIGDMMDAQGIDRFVHKGKNRASVSHIEAHRISTKRLREEYPEVAAMVEETTEERRVTIR